MKLLLTQRALRAASREKIFPTRFSMVYFGKGLTGENSIAIITL